MVWKFKILAKINYNPTQKQNIQTHMKQKPTKNKLNLINETIKIKKLHFLL